jgi:flagellar L-ring protein precursor FlgH
MASCWSSSERRRRRAAVGTAMMLTAIALGTSGCLEMYLRRPAAPVLAVVPPPPPSPYAKATGSLWRDDVSANYLFADTRARFPGDLLTILITEDSSGSKEADTSTSTETDVFANLEEFFGLPQSVAKHQPNIDPSQLIKGQTSFKWDGEGSTSRKGKLTARMTATVKNVSPNGNLLVQGEKVVAVNSEDQHIVVQGWVRPEDIDAQNQVLSTRLADARIDYYGVGVVGEKQREGWGLFLLDLVWPF